MLKYILLLVVIFSGFFGKTQNKSSILDSLANELREDSIKIYGFRKLRPYLNYHERNSIENPKIVNFFGPQIGVVLFERHITGLGIYFSTRNTKKPYPTYDNNAFVDKRINIKYITAFYQYVLIRKKYYELHLPFEVGRGTLHSEYIQHNNLYRKTEDYFTIAAVGTQLILKPIKWMGISTILGYRAASQKIIDGAFYAVGIWVGFKPITTDVNYYLKRRKYKKNLQLYK